MRILLYTGKGGVGKTSVSAATALRCADMGYRTIVLSTDSAHSLADSLDTELGPDPIPVADNLWAQELDVLAQTWVLALVLFAVILGLTLFQRKVVEKRVHYA